MDFSDQAAWAKWLAKHHASSSGVWLRHAKANARRQSITSPEALEEALCYGWIDGQKRSETATTWLQKFTPRTKRSIWSKINCAKAQTLVENGRMQPAGLAEIERAKQDGRWAAAYDSVAEITVPADLESALAAHPRGRAFFGTLTSQNRYAILFRISTAKKAETRARRIAQFVQMLDREETIYPQRKRA